MGYGVLGLSFSLKLWISNLVVSGVGGLLGGDGLLIGLGVVFFFSLSGFGDWW